MANKPFYIEWDYFTILAIAGISGAGKTTTARFLLCQLLINQVDIIVCDPHGNIPDRSLTSAIKPLQPYLAQPIAIDKDSRIRAIRQFYVEFLRRKENGTKKYSKIALVFDELTAHFIECTNEEIQEQINMLLRIANEANKLNMRVILLGQNWKSDYIGARSIRSSINAIIFHRLAGDESKLLVENIPTKIRREIAQLKTGYAYIYGAGHTFSYVKIPQITQDDIRDFAARFNFRDSLESRHSTAVNSSRDSLKIPPKNTKNKGITQEKIALMHRYILDGMGKEKTIKDVFGISKGSKYKPWLAASKMYDRMVQLMREQEE